MPDLITHITTTYLIVRLPSIFKNKIMTYYYEYRFFIFLGAIFPDLISKPFQFISPKLYNFSLPLHSPFVVTITAFIFTRFIFINNKQTSFAFLSIFSLIHIFVDSFQKGLNPGYQLLFPFSLKRYGLNLVSSELFIYILLITIVISVFFILVDKYKLKLKE